MSSIELIYSAQKRLLGNVRETPLLNSPFLDKIAGRKVLIKAECLQHTGSFKFRGAWSAISGLSKHDRSEGVLAYSSGNHAQGIASVAKIFSTPAVIIMPSDAPELKIENTKLLGAEVILYDRMEESREKLGVKLAKDRGLTLIKPYDDHNVIAGQGTLGLELGDQLLKYNISKADVLVCCGGGGLTAGVALALRKVAPNLRVRPCEPEDYDDTRRSLRSGKREVNNKLNLSICDAILTPSPGELTFPILNRLAGPGLVVSDREVLFTIAECFHRLKLVVEPGGAVALASALFRKDEIQGDTVIVVLTGGNTDFKTFKRAFDSR